MISDLLAQILSCLAALTIIALAEPRINIMSPRTRPGFRLAFLSLTVGAGCSLLALLAGAVPSWPAVILHLGVAALLLEERYCPRSCARRDGSSQQVVRLMRRSTDQSDAPTSVA